jgi:hypothetical protein
LSSVIIIFQKYMLLKLNCKSLYFVNQQLKLYQITIQRYFISIHAIWKNKLINELGTWFLWSMTLNVLSWLVEKLSFDVLYSYSSLMYDVLWIINICAMTESYLFNIKSCFSFLLHRVYCLFTLLLLVLQSNEPFDTSTKRYERRDQPLLNVT